MVRVHEHDTFEHVTDFESAADHVVTLEKFQELNLPISLMQSDNLGRQFNPKHESPFERQFDNTHESAERNEAEAKQFRKSGPWVPEMSETEFTRFLAKAQSEKPRLLEQLRRDWEAKTHALRRKDAQDKGEDLETLEFPKLDDEQFMTYIKELRANPEELGPVVYDLFDLPPTGPPPPGAFKGPKYSSPTLDLSSSQYAYLGPPKTHPSAGLSYHRSHALIHNHPENGPQTGGRPVEARILRPRGKFRNRTAWSAAIGVGGIVTEDLSRVGFAESSTPRGYNKFDATVPHGPRFWASANRAFVDSEGKISLSISRPSMNSKASYGVEDYRPQEPTTIDEAARGEDRTVPKLDKRRNMQEFSGQRGSQQAADNLMKTIS